MSDEEHASDADVRRIIAICGVSRRRRHWVLAARNLVVAVFGKVELDLRDVRAARPAAELRIVAAFGKVTVLVPPGADVELAGWSVAGTADCRVDPAPTRPPLPELRASAIAAFARIRVTSAGDPVPAGARSGTGAPPPDHRAPAAPAQPTDDPGPVPAAVPGPAGGPPTGSGADAAAPYVAPRALAVGELLRRCLPTGVRVRRAAVPLEAERAGLVAAYRTADGSLAAVCACDLPAAVSLAAARTGGSGDPAHLGPGALAAVREILAEAAELVTPASDEPAPALAELVPAPAALEPDVMATLAAPAARTDLAVEVDDQPGGAVSFLVAAPVAQRLETLGSPVT